MPDSKLIQDGARQMTICNACRYCEGYCAVFPAMEQRRTFTKADLTYLANLCFDCRDCYYACQYAPPHEFGVNIPKLMSELRAETYQEFTWPAVFSALFKRNALAVGTITAASIVIIFALVLWNPGRRCAAWRLMSAKGRFTAWYPSSP
jgi:citrate/tricarballylate utilization protein